MVFSDIVDDNENPYLTGDLSNYALTGDIKRSDRTTDQATLGKRRQLDSEYFGIHIENDTAGKINGIVVQNNNTTASDTYPSIDVK